ncbi:hypothetical protein ACLB9X_20485 [Streptomyces sp. 5K101]|uniref:hypothetical protein n=1 Tax=Streptomyces sp. 5K101 TaxID=3390037 RepID=UPI003976170C
MAKSLEQLTKDVGNLQAALDPKNDQYVLNGTAKTADISEGALKKTKGEVQFATQSWTKTHVTEATKTSLFEWIKTPEFLALVTAGAFAQIGGSLLKFEIMPFLNLDPAIEAWFKKKGFERNRWGVLWKLSEQELQRRERESPEYAIRRLQDMVVSAHTKIQSSNKRIGVLEKKVGRLTTRSNTTRQEIRHMDSNPALQGTTNQVVLLQRRVDLLAQALS